VPYPEDRLRQAGATDDEITQLAGAYEAASEPVQQSTMRYLDAIADLPTWLEELRQQGYFAATIDSDTNAAGDMTQAEKDGPASVEEVKPGREPGYGD
jgi:hypothetical protein